jgi:hypothetical protein
MDLSDAHFFVLSVADEYMPGPEIDDLLCGVHIEAGYKDERVTVFDPLTPEDARRVTPAASERRRGLVGEPWVLPARFAREAGRWPRENNPAAASFPPRC